MKRAIYFLVFGVFVLLFSSCTVNYYTSNPYDDVYYSRTDAVAKVVPVKSDNSANVGYTTSSYKDDTQYVDNNNDQGYYYDNNQPYSTTETYTDEKGVNYVTNNYYGDYYDYEYSSRLRRFYGGYNGFDYYDQYYTNLYWYNYDPYYDGVSIYYTYSW